jgi:hypothetical protein
MLATALIAIVIALKFAIPALLPRFPFQAGWANFVLDSVDGDLLIPLGLDDPVYQRVDKLADWVTYVLMVVAGWRWPIRRWLLALFAFRTVGQAIFFLTEDERVFFWFANFLEPLFLAYASILFFKRDGGHAFYLRHRAAVWSVVVLYKLQDEWFTHIANVDRSDLARRLLGP